MRHYLKPFFDIVLREENGQDENQDPNAPVILVQIDQEPIDQLPRPNI